MADDLMMTPIPRRGPVSRVLRRRSDAPDGPPPPRDLERSLQMLDEALGRPAAKRTGSEAEGGTPASRDASFVGPNTTGGGFGGVDVTRPLGQAVGRTFSGTDVTLPVSRLDVTALDDVTRPWKRQDVSKNDMSRTFNAMDTLDATSVLLEDNPGVKGTENLFDDFLSSSTGGSSGTAALETVAEFEQMVADHVEMLKRLINSVPSAKTKIPKTTQVHETLTNERNTWRLMGKLYNDRLVTSHKEVDEEAPLSPHSERQVIQRFFQKNAMARQAYLVVEWLEKSAQDCLEDLYNQVQYFTDATVSWENTQSALDRGTAGPAMVDELDPDVVSRTGKVLHDLDTEDEQRLLKALFVCLRCGLMEDGQELCVKVGQPWRAATLEGWKLFHDPNYETGTAAGGGGKLPLEGNRHRDVWKQVAWNLTQDGGLDLYERAVYAALCGNVKQLQAVCNSWEDLVWSGAKCAVDVMVETEIRETMVRSFLPLPPEYWNTPQSLGKVFEEALGHGGSVAQEAESPYHVIQRHLIMDSWPDLVRMMAGWAARPDADPHLLRLLAHLVLAHRSLGVAGHKEEEDGVLEAYTRYLMGSDRLSLVPWYVARLPRQLQLPIYSEYLAGITDPEDQKLCLYLGKEVGLDMASIVVAAVASVRQTVGGEDEEASEAMIRSLGWLTHEEGQAAHLIREANSVIRRLLMQGKTEAAARASAVIPNRTLGDAGRAWREGDVSGDVREHLGLHTFLSAHEAFNDWFGHFHRGQPQKPVLGEAPSFTEKVVHEQRLKQYDADMKRWRGGQLVQSRQAEAKLMDVLGFPGGWLVVEDKEERTDESMGEQQEEDGGGRREELESLRHELVPRTVTLLHSLLHNTGQYSKALQLAELVASEHQHVYTVYTKQGLRELLAKLRDSSLAGMEGGNCDALGYGKP